MKDDTIKINFLTESESIEATYFLLKIEKRSFSEVYN